MSDHPDPQEEFFRPAPQSRIRDGRLSRSDDDYKQENDDVSQLFTHTEHHLLQRPTSRESRTRCRQRRIET